MLLGALIELGASPAWLHGLPARLGVAGVGVGIDTVMRCGMRCTKVTVTVNGATEGPGDVLHGQRADRSDSAHHHHEDGHHHHHDTGHHHHAGHHPHRHVRELLDLIAAADLSPATKQRATQVFRLLAEAEGRIHGVPAESVALHEVGAFDALVDIVGVVEGFEQLGITDIRTRPVALGNGWVRAAHGLMPVPAPATALLVEGLAVAPDGPIQGEATTPTGAALLRVLASPAALGEWSTVKTGWGAGSRDPAGYANTLRVVIGESADRGADEVAVIATDLDDLSPEYLEPLRGALVLAGAIDVQTWPIQMKKGRTGFRVEALAPRDLVGPVTEAFFTHSPTAGVRRWTAARSTLRREHWVLRTDGGDQFRIKTIHGPAGAERKPEFDDVAAAALRSGQPAYQLFRSIQAQALRAEESAFATTKESQP